MNWLTQSWYQLLPHPWAHVLLAPVAAFCGALVGMEREHREKPAGIRTMSMVCLGAALFTIIGFTFTTTTEDSGRVAAQIVSGIGFLGAGIILRGSSGVHGMTTAATVWAVAAMGIVVGTGHACGGLAAALLILIVLSIVGRFERSRLGGSREERVTITFARDGGKTETKLRLIMHDHGIALIAPTPAELDHDLLRWELRFRTTARHHHEFFHAVAHMPEVRSIEC